MTTIVEDLLNGSNTPFTTARVLADLIGGTTILGGASIATVAGTARTLTDADHGKVLNCTSGSAVTVTVPAGLRSDFVCGLRQGGAGQVTAAAGVGVTIANADSQTATEKQGVMLSLMALALNSYDLSGRTA